jgi:hypothetical protein|uniref:Uncharacterized protein n=1 Tax=Populus trichocarpa TaxID=3694 RepID=A0A2K2BM78_POPTR
MTVGPKGQGGLIMRILRWKLMILLNGGFKDETIGHREGFWQRRNQRDFMYFDEVLWQKKRRIQKERWYQRERNKEFGVLKKESRILGEMKQELDVLTATFNAQQASEREEKIRSNDDKQNRTAATFIQHCWQRLLARKELQRLQKEAKELSIQLVGDSRTNHLEDRGNDTIQERSNSDFDVKCATIRFYGNSHNFQSDCWIELTFYVGSPDMFSYLGLKFQVNRSSVRYRNTGQQRLYEFCYLLPFDLWTSYLARILFLKGCGSLF